MRIMVIGAGAAARAVGQRLETEDGGSDLSLIDWDFVLAPRCPDVRVWHSRIASVAREEGIELVVILDRQPLVDGIVDHLTDEGLTCFGPTRAAAAAVQHPAATRRLLVETGLRTGPRPAGPASDLDAGEEPGAYLLSAFCDGASARLWPAVRRYTHARDGARGPVTEGMGAATLPEGATDRDFDEYVFHAVLGTLRERGIDYRGLLTATIRASAAGPAVADLGCHWGDPETQALLGVIDGSLLPHLAKAAAGGHHSRAPIPATGNQSVQVVLADPDYPNPTLPWTTDVLPSDTAVPFDEAPHATRPARRRLTIGGTGAGVEAARTAAYGNIGVFATQFQGGLPFHYRRDIAADLLLPAIDACAAHHAVT
jgi:phosphoribosylamine---glycine ligase